MGVVCGIGSLEVVRPWVSPFSFHTMPPTRMNMKILDFVDCCSKLAVCDCTLLVQEWVMSSLCCMGAVESVLLLPVVVHSV